MDTDDDFELVALSSTTIIIDSLEPRPVVVIKAFPILVEWFGDDDYIASFYAANCSISGESIEGAVEELKDIIAERFEDLKGTPVGRLGRALRENFGVLSEHLRVP